MRTSDLIHIALRYIKVKRAALPVLGFAVAAFCLCFAGAVFTSVREEKAQPCELIITSPADSKITDNKLAEVLKIENVEAETAVLQVPVTLQTGEYEFELSLTGMDGNYISGGYVTGSVFPPESAMPYIVLNEAACKKLTKEKAETPEKTPDIDWLNAGYTLSTDTLDRDIAAKVCGILSDGSSVDSEPTAYMSLPWAKELLRKSGWDADVKTALVRVKNIGNANSVAKQLSLLDLYVSNANDEQEQKWNIQTQEMVYLIVTGLFSLLCAAFLISVNMKATIAENKNSFDMLFWIGMKKRWISRMFLIGSSAITVIGTVIGIIVALALPSFLPQDPTSDSTFSLAVPFYIILLSTTLCIAAGTGGTGRYR